MRKSKNYYKFMEYMAFGISGWHEDAVMVDNGVIECVAYAKVANIEDYSKLYECNYDKMAMDSDNTWLTIKCVLVNEEVINVYYVTNERNLYIGQLILDDYRTQKQALDAIHKKVVCFFLNSRQFCEFHQTEEEINEYEEILESGEETTHATIETIPHVEVDCSNLKKVPKNSLYGMFGESQDTEHDRIKYLMDTHSLLSPVSINSHCMETVLNMEELFTQRYGNVIAHKCKMYNNGYYGCPADRQGNRCCGEKWCAETWKRYEAIINPEWHHVSLATLANIDFDMLDKKRQVYLKAHRELKRTLSDLSKCKSGHTYEARARKFMRDMISQYYDNEISYAMRKYLDLQLSMSNVVNGVWSSYVEPAMGLHESRRYSRPTLTY